MKKLLLLLFLSLGLTSISYAETIVCPYISKYYGTIQTMEFKRLPHSITGEIKFLDDMGLPYWDISYESENYLVLHDFSNYSGLATFIVDKKSNKFSYTNQGGVGGFEQKPILGNCTFVN